MITIVVVVTKSLVGRIKSRVPRFHRLVLFDDTSQKRQRRPSSLKESHKVSQLNHTDSHAKIQSNEVLKLANTNSR